MKKITIDAISDGMVLAKELRGKSGNVLLSRGAPLTVALGKRLKNWGIGYVYVEGDDETLLQHSSGEMPFEEIRTKLDAKFSAVMQHQIMKELFAAVYQFKTNRGQ